LRIIVASLEASKHPRALKIAKTLLKHGYEVDIWEAPKIFTRIKHRLVRAFLRYSLAMISLCVKRADLYWVENVPDVLFIPLIFLRKKYIYDRRSPWSFQVLYETGSRFLHFLSKLLEMLSMRYSVSIVCVSRALALDSERFQKPLYVIPNYPEASFRGLVKDDLRKRLAVPRKRKIFLYIGKLSKIEGTRLLEEVAKGLIGCEAQLWIVGDGPEREFVKELERRYSSTVRWFGWVPRSMIPSFIAACDVGIVPREDIPYPYRLFYSHEGIHKIGEYLLFGKPVIASGIAPSKYYFLSDPKQLGETVRMIAEGRLRLNMVDEELSWENKCEQMVLKVVKDIESGEGL